jgi:hypothetical protein
VAAAGGAAFLWCDFFCAPGAGFGEAGFGASAACCFISATFCISATLLDGTRCRGAAASVPSNS